MPHLEQLVLKLDQKAELEQVEDVDQPARGERKESTP